MQYDLYHDLLMMFMNLGNIASINLHNADCCCFISGISKS